MPTTRSELVMQVLKDARRHRAPVMNEHAILSCLRELGDHVCTEAALRMTLRGLEPRVRCVQKGPRGMAKWEVR